MKNWLIRKLGGFTRRDLERLQGNLRAMAEYKQRDVLQAKAEGDLTEMFYYSGKQSGVGCAVRCIGDLLR